MPIRSTTLPTPLRNRAAATLLVIAGVALSGCGAPLDSDAAEAAAELTPTQSQSLCDAVGAAETTYADYRLDDRVWVRQLSGDLAQVEERLDSLDVDSEVLDPLADLQEVVASAKRPYDVNQALQQEFDSDEDTRPLAAYIETACPASIPEDASVREFCQHLDDHADVDDDVLEAAWSKELRALGGPADMTEEERDGLRLRAKFGAAPDELFDFLNPYLKPDIDLGPTEAYEAYAERTCTDEPDVE